MNFFLKKAAIGFIVASLISVPVTGFSAESYVIGTVEKRGEALILFTPDDTYVLKSSDVLSDMIGKKVIVTGNIEEEDQEKVITVMDLKEVKDQ